MNKVRIIVVMIFLLLLTGCNESVRYIEIQNEVAVESAVEEESIVTIGFVGHDMNHRFISSIFQYLQEEINQRDDVKLLALDSSLDPKRQSEQIYSLMENPEIDGIIINPTNITELKPVVEEINQKDMPYLFVNMRMDDEETVYIGSNDVEAGVLQGEYIAKKLEGKGKILLLLGASYQTPTIERREGLMSVLEEYPDIEILAEDHADWELFAGLKQMEEWLDIYPEFDAIVSQNDEMLLGALTVLEKRGIKTVSIGVDGLPEAIESIKEGKMSATIFQDAKAQAESSLDEILSMIRSGSQGQDVLIPFQTITRDNVDEYLNETYYIKQ